MHPRIGKRTQPLNGQRLKAKTVQYIENNTHKIIGIKEKFVYLDDVQHAININAIEQRLMTKQWFVRMIEKGYELSDIRAIIEESSEIDRHRLVKPSQNRRSA